MSARSSRCAADRHAWHADGWCTRRGCTATRTRDLFGRPLDADAGPLFTSPDGGGHEPPPGRGGEGGSTLRPL